MDLFILPYEMLIFIFGKLPWIRLISHSFCSFFFFVKIVAVILRALILCYLGRLGSHCFAEWSSELCVSCGLEAARISSVLIWPWAAHPPSLRSSYHLLINRQRCPSWSCFVMLNGLVTRILSSSSAMFPKSFDFITEPCVENWYSV